MTEPTGVTPPRPGPKRRIERVSTLVAMAAVLWFYFWSVDLQHGFQRGLPARSEGVMYGIRTNSDIP